MAGIDKTYTSSWEEYRSLVEWCKDKSFVLKNGDVVRPSRYIYKWQKEDFDGEREIPVWNTPTYLDIWLIRNCPIEFIQERLKEQYGGGWSKTAFTEHNNDDMYYRILTHTSPYDTFQRNGSHRFSVHYVLNNKFKDDDLVWWIDIRGCGWWYNEKHKMWYHLLDRVDERDARLVVVEVGELRHDRMRERFGGDGGAVAHDEDLSAGGALLGVCHGG